MVGPVLALDDAFSVPFIVSVLFFPTVRVQFGPDKVSVPVDATVTTVGRPEGPVPGVRRSR